MGWPASSPEAAELEQWCIICGFWSPDYTKVKNHICQARQRDGDAAMKLCQGYSAQALKGHACPFCHRHDYDKRKHPGQCVVLFQLCFHRRHVHGTAGLTGTLSDSWACYTVSSWFFNRTPQTRDPPPPPQTTQAPNRGEAPRIAAGGRRPRSEAAHYAQPWQHMLGQFDFASPNSGG